MEYVFKNILVPVIVAVLTVQIWNLIFTIRKEKREYTEKQIKELYGPLNSLILQNKILSVRGDSIQAV